MTPRRVGTALLLSALLVGIAELVVRTVGLQPSEWSVGEPPGVKLDPLLGPLGRPGWSGEFFGGFQVTMDERGFRTTPLPPTNPTRRVVFLGDSCTFGWGMHTPDTFVAMLEDGQRRDADRPELINAAFPGQSAVAGEAIFRERILPLHPDVVVLGFGANNAFRLSLVGDVARFRFLGLRRLLLRSRLYQVVGPWMAVRLGRAVHPRDRQAIHRAPLAKLSRVAFLDEFEAAMRRLVLEARDAGAVVVLLIFPRASAVSTAFSEEDATSGPLPVRQPGTPTSRELGLLESSCLDHRQFADPVGTLHERRSTWHRVYPQEPVVRSLLQEGSAAYVRGDYAAAAERFTAAVAAAPESPLALYDLGIARLALGDATALRELAEADHLACNAFLQYQVALWRLATELHIPAVDITLYFQAHDGTPLFIDPAHPNRDGHRIIADALQPAITRAVTTGLGRKQAR